MRYAAQKQEMRRRVAAEAEVRKLAFQDALTGLPKRRQFDDALKAALASPPRSPGMHGVFLLDLNGFKQINDIYGHGVGDEVLVIVAQRLFGAMRAGDLIARLGGDEFSILALNLLGPESATNLARRVIQALDTPITTGKREHRVAVAIGVAFVPGDATTREEILRRADVALYRAKSERRSALRFFEEQMDHHIHEHDRLARELRTALTARALEIVYQPTIDLASGEVVAFEVLPRWTHPELGEIPPPTLHSDRRGSGHDSRARRTPVTTGLRDGASLARPRAVGYRPLSRSAAGLAVAGRDPPGVGRARNRAPAVSSSR